MVHGGGKREVVRREPVPGKEQRFTGFEVEPLDADVTAFRA